MIRKASFYRKTLFEIQYLLDKITGGRDGKMVGFTAYQMKMKTALTFYRRIAFALQDDDFEDAKIELQKMRDYIEQIEKPA